MNLKGAITYPTLLVLFLFPILVLAGDITPPHPEGLFVELTSIGYSWGRYEISTAPLLDIVGDYNLRLRYFPTGKSVLQLSGNVLDPGLLPTYAGQPRDLWFFLWNVQGYYHLNMDLGKFTITPHVELNNSGAVNTDPEHPEYRGWINGIWMKGFLQLGYHPTEKTEVFATLEAGTLLDVSSSSTDTSFQDFERELKANAGYVLFKVGGRWYYDPYSSVELGYRLILDDGVLRYAQGYTPTDWVYNFFAFLAFTQELNGDESSPQINIPFITTDYYLTFSARF